MNIAILSLSDFENWNNKKSISMGGATGVIKSILPYLQADKIYLMGITSDKSNLYKEIQFSDNIIIVPIAFVPKKTKIPVRLHAFYYSRKINSILDKYDIYCVYSHSEEMSFWLKQEIKLIYHMHGSTNALLKAKNEHFRNIYLQKAWEYLRKVNIKKAAKIIAIDPLCYNITRNQNAEKKASILPNFVDKKVFYKDDSPSKLLEHIKEKILLFIGRLEEVKGLELFVDILIEIDQREPGIWKGVLVGRGTYEPVIKKYISDKSVTDLFLFTGPVFEQDELRKIYNRASILIISSYFEGIPMVVLESLACRTPVISTDVGGVKDIISDNIMCFIINKRDPKEFADKVQSIMSQNNSDDRRFKFSSSEAAVIINNMLKD